MKRIVSPQVSIGLIIPKKVAEGMRELAKQRGWPVAMLASHYLIAAYSVRLGKDDDGALADALALIHSPGSGDPASKEAVRAKMQENESLRGQLDSIKRRFRLLEIERDKLDEASRGQDEAIAARDHTIASLRRDVGALRERLAVAERQVCTLSAQIGEVARERDHLSVSLTDARECLTRCINEAHAREAALRAELAAHKPADDLRPPYRPETKNACPSKVGAAPGSMRERAAGNARLITALRAAGNSPAEIAAKTGFSVQSINAILKVRL